MKITNIFSVIAVFLLVCGCNKNGKEEISSTPLEVSDNELINYSVYCNDRFDVCIDYPSNFGAKPEPINGDGRTFVNEIDSAEIILYGFIDQGQEGLETQLDIINEMIEIDKLTDLENGYEIYGKNRETNKIHRERILLKPDNSAANQKDSKTINVITSLQFVYPEEKSNKYDGYWEKINQKFE